jgi:WD40 repeat protein
MAIRHWQQFLGHHALVSLARLKMTAALLLLGGAVLIAQPRRAGSVSEGEAVADASGSSENSEAPAPIREDRLGDPLPAGAIARLGTGRSRNGMFKPHFFPDGKTIMTANRHALQFWETATGRLLREISTGSLYVWRTALSADGKQAAATGVFHDSTSSQGALCVWDVSTGKEVRTLTDKERKVEQTSLTFTPDGKQLVSIPGGALSFEDVASGKEVRRRQFSTDILPASALAPDGETVAIAPGANTWKFYLWNWKAEEEPREIKVTRRPLRSICFSPDSKMLAGCGGLEPVIELWEVRSGRVVRTLDMSKESVCAADLAFSPDGKVLAVADSGNRKNFSGGLYLWDLERDRYVHKLLTPGEQVLFTSFSRDGRWVAATTSRGFRVWELRTGRAVAESGAGHSGRLTRIAVSSHRLAATASIDHTVRIWDAATGRQSLKLQHDQPVENVVFAADGTNVITATTMDNTIRIWDINTGKEIKRLPGQERIATGRALGLTPDGRRLLSWADNRSLRIWDVPTGKVLQEHNIPPGDTGKSDREKGNRRELLMAVIGPCSFSPDGAYFILPFFQEFRIYETANGKVWQTIPNNAGGVNSLAISSDGRSFLASIERRGVQSEQHTVSLWELATGKLRSSLSLPGQSAGPVALSPDGGYFAVGLLRTPGEIRLYRLTDPNPVLTFAGFTGKPTLLSFSSDGRLLISGMDNTSALVWQLPSSMGQPSRGMELETIRRLWDDLSSDDAARAYQAILNLAQSPAEVVSFLDKYLQPVAAPDQKRIVQLIKDLDDGRYEVRSTAEAELGKLGELAEANLRRSLADKPSLEARQRLEQLLSRLRGPIRTPRLLQSIRAVEVLERIDSPEARRLMEQLAQGAPAARLTQDASAALTRLRKR